MVTTDAKNIANTVQTYTHFNTNSPNTPYKPKYHIHMYT